MKGRMRSLGVVLGMILAVFLCPGKGHAADAADRPVIAGNEKTMYLDGKNRISIVGEHIVSVAYASSNRNIATISKKGLVVPKRMGKTTIRATVVYKKKAGGKKYTSKLSYKLTVLGKAGEYFTYGLKINGKAYEIRGLTKKGMECKNLYIPGYIGGKKVSIVGWNALSGNTVLQSLHLSDKIARWWRGDKENFPNLKKIYLGKSMKKFGNWIFLSGCPALREIILDSRNEHFCVEENVLFTKDKSKLICYPAQKEGGSYEVPYEVKIILNGAFSGCKNLKQVTFTDNLETLAEKSFADSGLTTVFMPDEIEYVENGVFSGCDSLSEVRLSKRMTSISVDLFKNCISLKKLEIPASVERIYNLAFEGCTQFTDIEVASANKNFISRDGVLFSKNEESLICYPMGKKEKRYVVPERVKIIEGRAFCDSKGLNEVVLPKGLEQIEWKAFYGCTGLTEMILPDTVHTIWTEAFTNCEKLSKIILSDSLTELSDDVFSYCTGLTEITIPKEVSKVSAYAFKGCSNLKRFLVDGENTTFAAVDGILFSSTMQILYCYPQGKAEESYTVPGSVKRLKNAAFMQARWLEKLSIPDTVKYIEPACFKECESLETVKLPNKLTEISNVLFEDCDALTAIKIPASVKTIGTYAFNGCNKLMEVKIPNSVETIGMYAFNGCNELIEVKIPNSVKKIDMYAFYSCENLKKVTIGTGVETIWSKAFAQCCGLKSMVVKTTKLKADSVAKHAFEYAGAGDGKKLTVEVPKSKKTAYTNYFRKAGLSKNAVIK